MSKILLDKVNSRIQSLKERISQASLYEKKTLLRKLQTLKNERRKILFKIKQRKLF